MMDPEYREKWTDASHLTALGNGQGGLRNRGCWGDWEPWQHPVVLDK